MKPNPQPVQAAVTALAAKPASCVLIGNSLSDITAGRAAGVRTIGYANKPGKYAPLAEAGAGRRLQRPRPPRPTTPRRSQPQLN